MNLAEIFNLDPQGRRKIIYVAIMVFVLIAVGLIPVVIQTNFFQPSSSVGQGFVPATATSTITPTLSPLPHSQAFVSSNETEPVATLLPRNCTYPTAYWLEHQDSWPALISVGDFNYTKEQAFAYIQSSRQSTWDDLFLHLHTTLLNLLSGSDPGEVKLTVTDAISWLNTFADNNAITELDVQIGQVLAQQLSDFNNGVIGPGLCEGSRGLLEAQQLTAMFSQPGEIAGTTTLTPSPTLTSASPTSGGVVKPRYTSTPTPTQKEDEPPPPPPPTATKPPPPTATKPPPPTNTSPPPTNTSPPPTNTSPPPTERPTPTMPPP